MSKTTKVELVDAVYERITTQNKNINKDSIKLIVEEFLGGMRLSLEEGHSIELRGFGVFEFRYRKPKSNARNPKTGEKVFVPGHSIVAFRSGAELKEAVWKKEYGKEK